MKQAGGFTLIETLLVMGITAAMLGAAMLMIGGQRSRTEFTEAARDFQTKLQSVLNDVANNTYPNAGKISCTATATGVSFSDTDTDNTGKNLECLVVGKAVSFYGTNGSAGMITHTLVGRRFNGVGSTIPVTSYSESRPAIARTGTSTLSDEYQINSSLSINGIYKVVKAMDGTETLTQETPILGVLTSLNGVGGASMGVAGAYSATDGGFNSGTQNMFLAPLGDPTALPLKTGTDQLMTTALTRLGNLSSQPTSIAEKGYIICISNGGSGAGRKYATVTITGTGSSAGVSTEINGGRCS